LQALFLQNQTLEFVEKLQKFQEEIKNTEAKLA
jgi:hypothetical protein